MNQLALLTPFDFDDDDGGLPDPVSPSLVIVGCIAIGLMAEGSALHRRRSRSL